MPMSGKKMLRLYEKAGWQIMGQRGSHVKVGKNGWRETIPQHAELRVGLEHKLLKRLQETGGQQ